MQEERATAADAPGGAAPAPLAPWLPFDSRLTAVLAVLALVAVLDLVNVVVEVMELRLLERLERGEDVAAATIEANDNRVLVAGVLQTIALIAAAVVWIVWFHRAYRNVDAVAPQERRHGHGWAIGGWFVPILALWRPKAIANDIARAGGTGPGPLMLAWWLVFLVDSALGRAAGRTGGDGNAALQTTDRLYIASDSLDVIAAGLAAVVAIRLTRGLERRRTEIEAAVSRPAPEAAPPA